MIMPATPLPMTALNGTPEARTFRKWLEPGMPRSRENAKHMREALVRQARPQKSCPTVQISTTALKAAGVSAWLKMASADPAPNPLLALLTKLGFCTAKVIARMTNQPMIAE